MKCFAFFANHLLELGLSLPIQDLLISDLPAPPEGNFSQTHCWAIITEEIVMRWSELDISFIASGQRITSNRLSLVVPLGAWLEHRKKRDIIHQLMYSWVFL
jgi:hypothetical protein